MAHDSPAIQAMAIPGQQLRYVGHAVNVLQRAGFTADLFDAPVQFAAQAIAGQHRGAVTMGHAPEHFVQQVPALLAAIASGLFQLA